MHLPIPILLRRFANSFRVVGGLDGGRERGREGGTCQSRNRDDSQKIERNGEI